MFGGYGNTIALKTPFMFSGYGHTTLKTHSRSQVTVTYRSKPIRVLRSRSHNAQNPLMFSGYGDTTAPKPHSCSQILVTQLHPNLIHVLRFRWHNCTQIDSCSQISVTQLHAKHIHVHRLRWHNYTQNPFMFTGYDDTITPKTHSCSQVTVT